METPHAGGEEEAGSARKCGAIHVRLLCCEPSGRSCAALSHNGAATKETPTETSGGVLAELGNEGSNLTRTFSGTPSARDKEEIEESLGEEGAKSTNLFADLVLGVPSTQVEGMISARTFSDMFSGQPLGQAAEEVDDRTGAESGEPLGKTGALTRGPFSLTVLRKCGATHVKFGCKGGSAANGGRAGKEGKERTVQGETAKDEFARGGGSSKAGGRGREALERVPAPSLVPKLLASGGPGEGSRTRLTKGAVSKSCCRGEASS